MSRPGLFARLASGALLGGLGFGAAALATLWGTPRLVNGLGLDNYAVLGLLVGVQGGLLMVLGNPVQAASLVLLGEAEGEELDQRSGALSAWTLLSALLAVAFGWMLSLPPLGRALWRDEMLALQWSAAAPWAGLGWGLQLMLQGLWSAQRARHRQAWAEGQQAVVGVLVTLAPVLAVLAGQGLQGAVEAQSAVWLLGLLLGLAMQKGLGGLRLRPLEHRPSFKRIWNLAAWTLLALTGAAVLLYADRLYSLKASPRELAAWAVATALSLRVAAGLGMLGPLLLPSLSAAKGDDARFGRLQGFYLRVTGIAGLGFFVPLAAGGAALLGAWVAPEVEERARPWVALLALAGLGLCLNNSLLTLQLGRDGAREAAKSALSAALFGLLAGALAQGFGFSGAAWMAVAGQGLALVWRARWVQAQGLGRPGWAWAALLWLLGGAGMAWLLPLMGFPYWFGASFKPVLAAFVAGAALCTVLGLAVDHWLSQRRGEPALWALILRRA